MIDFSVILVETEFESTIGFIARAMRNFNLRDLRLVNPTAAIGREARMRASHAQNVLDEVRTFSSLKDALQGADISVGTTAQRATSIYRILRKPVTPSELSDILSGSSGKVALVFGREGTGLRNGELEACDLTLTISASPEYPTLNISHAAVIIFHELYASTSQSSVDILAADSVKEEITRLLERTAVSMGLADRNARLVRKAFRSMMARSSLRAREASLLAGFFRKVSIQLDSKGKHSPHNDASENSRSKNGYVGRESGPDGLVKLQERLINSS